MSLLLIAVGEDVVANIPTPIVPSADGTHVPDDSPEIVDILGSVWTIGPGSPREILIDGVQAGIGFGYGDKILWYGNQIYVHTTTGWYLWIGDDYAFVGTTDPSVTGPLVGDYYVSPAGNDSHDGLSLGTAFRTLQHAVSVVNPGDVVLVDDGVYTGNTNAAVCDVSRGGSSGGGYVVFQAINRGGAKLDGQSNTSDYGFRMRASYVEVNGFEIYGTAGTGVYVNEPGTSNFRIIHNHIHDIGRYCDTADFGLVGVFTRQPHTYIDGNIFHDIGRYAPGENGCTADPVSSPNANHNHDHGVYSAADGSGSDQAHYLTIINNVFYNIVQGWGCQIDKGSYVSVVICNNTYYGMNPARMGQLLFIDIGTIQDLKVNNNIFANPNTAGIYFYDGTYTGTLECKNNLIWSGSGGVQLSLNSPGIAANVIPVSTVNGNPNFIDAATGNFHIASGAAVDAGVNVTEVTTDLFGTARVSGSYDIGAYEK